MPNLNFTFEPDMHISGFAPTNGDVGSTFRVTGSGVCFTTGAYLVTSYNSEIPFTFTTGLIDSDTCALTGYVPDVAPQPNLSIRLVGRTSEDSKCCFQVTENTCILNCDVIVTGDLTVSGDVGITGDLTYSQPPINNSLTGFLIVDDFGKVHVRQIDPTGTTGQYNPAGVIMIAGSGLVGGGDVTISRRFDVGAGTGIHLTEDTINVNTGEIITTGQAFFNVDPGPGLTGDHRVYLGETLDLGVFVDNETIKFTGVSGNEIGAFTVVDGGITPEKVSFGFAGSNIKSGAANSVSGYITGGIGLDSFIWSGDENLVLNLDPTGVVYTSGDQDITGDKNFQGRVTIQELEVLGLLTATGDGIFVSDLRVTGDVSGVMANKSLAVSGLNTTDRYATSEVFSFTPQKNEGLEIFNMAYAAQSTGNYLILDVELNLGVSDQADAIICIFKDEEQTPIRAWTHNVYTIDYGQIYNMKYFIQYPEDTDIHNYKIKIGRRAVNGYNPLVYVNRLGSWPPDYPYASGYLGDAAVSSFVITEIKPHPTGSRW